MRSLQLEAALGELIEAAAGHLQAALAAGEEVPFEVEQQSAQRGGAALYCYRPLTGKFISAHRRELEALAAHEHAAQLLGDFDGLQRYLVGVGVDPTRMASPARARAAIAALLEDVFAEQSDFNVRPERLREALARLERSALTSTSEVALVAALHGMTIASAEVALTAGLTIAKPHAIEGLPPALAAGEDELGGHLVVVLAAEDDDPAQALWRGRAVLTDLLRALRLFGDGRVTLGELAWARIGGGAWSPLALGSGGRPHGMLVVTPEQEDELRAFCNLVSRRAPVASELAWALRRFELGCDRDSYEEALSDHLAALRALLEPEGPGSGHLPGRLAALCATPQSRMALTQRIVEALALERAVIAGTATPHAGALALANDVADHLRALLRDVVCGHLEADLVSLADELLLAEAQPPAFEPTARQQPAPAPVAAHQPMPDRERIVSGEEMPGDALQAEEVLDLFI